MRSGVSVMHSPSSFDAEVPECGIPFHEQTAEEEGRASSGNPRISHMVPELCALGVPLVGLDGLQGIPNLAPDESLRPPERR